MMVARKKSQHCGRKEQGVNLTVIKKAEWTGLGY